MPDWLTASGRSMERAVEATVPVNGISTVPYIEMDGAVRPAASGRQQAFP
ncbi:MAG: hypothetical protein ACLTYN_13440 [Dysosmobacter welbionis]